MAYLFLINMNSMNKWNYETCFEEAKKYKSVTEFHNASKGAYKKAWQNGWLADYTFFVNPKQKWTKETCFLESKKYTSKSEFKEKNGSAYTVARENGWLKDYFWLKEKQKPKGYWNEERCLAEAKKYTDYTLFSKTVAGQVAIKRGWANNYTWIKKKHVASGYWTKDRCVEEALKYKSYDDFRRLSSSAYGSCVRNGWVKDILDLGVWERKSKPNGYWNKEHCFEEAQKYTSRWEFEQNCPGAKHVAKKNGWIDDYTWFSERKSWDYNTCREEAKKYNSVWDFHNESSGAYHKAYNEGWLYDFKWLFENSNHNSQNYKFNLLEEFANEYRLREWLTIADVNIIHIILRNLQQCKTEFSPIIKEIDKLVDKCSSDPIKDLEAKYRKDSEQNNEAIDTIYSTSIDGIDLDDDDAIEGMLTAAEDAKKEPTIDDIIKANDIQLHIINEIEHMLTPEDKLYLKDKFLNDRRRDWMRRRDKN